MAAVLPLHDENDRLFDPVLVYDVVLGLDVPVTTKQVAVEAVTKLPLYLEKYTARAVPAYPCELFIDNAWSKLSINRDFCAKVAKDQLPTTLFKQMRGSGTAQGASELKLWHGNPFPRSHLINPMDSNLLTGHCKIDSELLHLREHFTVKYKESLILRANISSIYDLVYNKLIIMHQPY